jgi:predicted transcriptional regulator
MMDTYLISVKPNWADRFFSIATPKTVELRKGSFGQFLKADDRLLIYATLPVGEVIGEVRVRDRVQYWIDKLRSETENFAQVSPEDFNTYYRGKDYGVAVWVDRPKRFESAIALAALKEAGIMPPQQLLKLSSEQVDTLSIRFNPETVKQIHSTFDVN